MLAQKSGEHRAKLEQFFEKLTEQTASNSAPQLAHMMTNKQEASKYEADLKSITKGRELINKLSKIPGGTKSAKDCEAICRDIIDYIFARELRDGRSQKRTSEDGGIFDLIYRVSPKHLFWITSTRYFRARVILFEYKNYTDPIDPFQVFTMERYLSASALRPICFVLSRKPVNKNAIMAASCAMRESRKLLVFLSDDDLGKMLLDKDAQIEKVGAWNIWRRMTLQKF